MTCGMLYIFERYVSWEVIGVVIIICFQLATSYANAVMFSRELSANSANLPSARNQCDSANSELRFTVKPSTANASLNV